MAFGLGLEEVRLWVSPRGMWSLVMWKESQRKGEFECELGLTAVQTDFKTERRAVLLATKGKL